MHKSSCSDNENPWKRKRVLRNDDKYKRIMIKKGGGTLKGTADENHVGKTIPVRTTEENCM